MVPIYWAFYPIILLLSEIANGTLKIFLGKYIHREPITTEEDISFIIKMSHKEGLISKDEKKMLKNVMNLKKTHN